MPNSERCYRCPDCATERRTANGKRQAGQNSKVANIRIGIKISVPEIQSIVINFLTLIIIPAHRLEAILMFARESDGFFMILGTPKHEGKRGKEATKGSTHTEYLRHSKVLRT
jgi:hypothetical protein